MAAAQNTRTMLITADTGHRRFGETPLQAAQRTAERLRARGRTVRIERSGTAVNATGPMAAEYTLHIAN